jgi:hypothetical protein
MALRNDRTAWGINEEGQLGDGTAAVRVPVQALWP